jgi:hypothetical protein
MSGEIERWTGGGLPDRKKKREIQARQLDEELAAHQARVRLDNAYGLGNQATARAAALNANIKSVAHDDPGLELTLRGIEEVTTIVAKSIIFNYGTRP